jgi:hypothetical protein
MEAVGFPPRVLAIGRFRAVERIAGVPEGLAGVARSEERFGESEAEIDGEPSEAAGVGEQDTGFGFGNGLGEIAEMAVQFAGGAEAAELELDVSRMVGEAAGVLKMLGGSGGIVGKEEPGQESVAAAEIGAPVAVDRPLPVGLCLAECSRGRCEGACILPPKFRRGCTEVPLPVRCRAESRPRRR